MGPAKDDRTQRLKTGMVNLKWLSMPKNRVAPMAKKKLHQRICSKNIIKGKAAGASRKKNFGLREASLQCVEISLTFFS